jgi:acetyl esterase/lipase
MPDPRDLTHLCELLAAEQAGVAVTPPPELTADFEVVALDGYGADAECPAYAVTPRGPAPERTVFYLHGGGHVGHAAPQHWRFAGRLARRANARVVVAQYPIAPASTWREAYPAVLEVYRKVAAEADQPLVLLGDSAGAGFALALAQRAVASGDRTPDKLVLFTPWGDLAIADPVDDPWISHRYLTLAGELWAGGDPVRLPEISPLFAEFAGLPPTLVICGTKDLLLEQSRAIVAKARAAGVETTYVEGRGLVHGYPVLNLPEAKQALEQVVAFLDGRAVDQGRTS